jgi:hypothetical protein
MPDSSVGAEEDRRSTGGQRAGLASIELGQRDAPIRCDPFLKRRMVAAKRDGIRGARSDLEREKPTKGLDPGIGLVPGRASVLRYLVVRLAFLFTAEAARGDGAVA